MNLLKKYGLIIHKKTISSSTKTNIDLIEVKNLSVDYEQKKIINALSLCIPSPGFLAVLGHNGSGKSTFLKALSNKISYSGSISFPDSYSYLGQSNQVNFPIKVKDLMLMGLRSFKHFSENYTSADEQKVLEKLQFLNLEHLFDSYFHQISGGEQQMIWILQILLKDSPIYLFDEPTQNLDLKNKRKIFDLFTHLVEKNQKTIVCVTHDLHNISSMKGQLINFSAQKIELETLSPETVQKHYQLLEEV